MVKKSVLTLLIIVVVGLGMAYLVRNAIVKKAVVAGSTYALGVETSLGSASLNIGGGSLELNDFAVENPEGFTAKHFLELHRGSIAVDAGSVFDKQVRIDSLIIDGVSLDLEQIDTKGNYKVILDNIKRIDMSSSGESRTFRFDLIALRNIDVSASLNLLGNKTEKSYKLEDFTMRDVGGDNGSNLSQITATLVKSLIAKALAGGGGRLPDGFGKDLGELKDQGLDKLKSGAEQKLKDLGKSLTGSKK